MSLKDQIHELFGVKEAHELPAAVMKTVMDPEELSKVIINYRKSFPDLKQDVLRDYFQECSADRKSFMQDYTPDGICQIVAGITGKQKTIADLCAGTGSLTIAIWAQNPDTEFTCYELSTAAIPLLLFNLAVRKIKAKVIAGDVLTQDYTVVYQVEAGRVIRSEPDATRGQLVYLNQTGPVDSRYAVIQPKDVPGFYLFCLLESQMPDFLKTHQTGLNIQPAVLNEMVVTHYPDPAVQKEIALIMAFKNCQIKSEETQIKKLAELKRYLLGNCFPESGRDEPDFRFMED